MSAAVMMRRIAEASPRFEARMAGVLFLLLLLTAAFTEFFVRGRLSFAADLAAGVIEVSCMIAVTLLFYDIFKPVNRRLSLLAASFNFVGLIFELSISASGREHRPGISRILLDPDWLPHFQVNLPASNSGRAAGDRGLCWLTFLSPPLTNYLTPYNLASALLLEGLVMLWLLVTGLNVQRWKEQAGAAGERQ
jgi:hypothetical protein